MRPEGRGARALRAGLAGLLGAAAGHWAVLAARRLTGDADIWLKGPHGPPFFELCLATGGYFACLGAGLAAGGGWRGRAKAAAATGAAAFGALALPLAVGTRIFRWGEDSPEPTRAWMVLVLVAYAAACAAGAYSAGCVAGEPGSRWRWGLRAMLGAFAAWVVDRWVLAAVPFKALDPLAPPGLFPSPATFVTGLAWGLGVALALPARAEEKQAGGGR